MENYQEKRPHVQMCATISFVVGSEVGDVFEIGKVNIDIGGFEFECKGKSVQFDFDATGLNLTKTPLPNGETKICLEYQSGYGPFFNDFEIAQYFDDAWAREGLTPADVTAAFLASAEKVIEFYFSVCGAGDSDLAIQDVQVSDVAFSDGEQSYPFQIGTFAIGLSA